MKRILKYTCGTCGLQVWFKTLKSDEHPKMADDKLSCQSVDCNRYRMHKKTIEEVDV